MVMVADFLSLSLFSNYLLSWLSSVGPVVHLDIPLSYCTSAIK